MTIASNPPGVSVSVTTAPPSPNSATATSTWFVTGQTAQGPTGVAVPVTSMNDYLNFLGGRVSYGFLYDALQEYFSDGGVLAYVSRIVGPMAGTATIVLHDSSAVNTLTLSAAGAGSWGNNLSVVVTTGTVSNSYQIGLFNAGVSIAQSTNLFTPNDAQVFFSALSPWECPVIVVNDGSSTVAPGNNPVPGTFVFANGSDDTADVSEAQWTNALLAFPQHLGPGQVSAPGHTTQVGYETLLNHAYNFNRYALLDVADSATASTLVAQAQSCQTVATIDPSYGALFAPWVTIPGIVSTAPGTTSPIPNRLVPPSALAAAKMAANDLVNSSNVPVAGSNGQSAYAIGVSQSYSSADRATLNNAGITLIKVVNATGLVTIYGNVSLAIDPAWQQLSNARFRMQIVNDSDNIGEGFIFDQIDGQGHLFAKFNAALAGLFQQYFIEGSVFGDTPAQAFLINTGPQVNTPNTINLGQINAVISAVLSPGASFVNIQIVKFSVVQGLPV